MSSSSSMDGDQYIDEINLSSGDEGATHVPPPKVKTQQKKRKRGTNVRQGVKVYHSKSTGKTRNLTAECWNHFEGYTDEEDGCFKARCIYCKRSLKADPNNNGTSTLNRHKNSCKANPNNNKNQSNIVLEKHGDGEGGSGSVKKWEFNKDRVWRAVLNLFVSAELPFSLIRHPAMIELMAAATPHYSMPSRWTATKGVTKWYVEEKEKLFKVLSRATQGVHLTTDTWTSSNQRKNYMVLTAHYIDDDWVLQKKIINFKCIHSHKGDDIGREILDCITEWNLQNVMTMTVDNATSNDKAIKYLIDRLPNLFDKGEQFQVRCMAHILNLIVKDGLVNYDHGISGVHSAVRYIKHSTQRIDTFQECVVEERCDSKKFLCLDCPTRWNSTLDMLRTAWELRKAFVRFERRCPSYVADLEYVPHLADWVEIEKVIEFLEPFKEKTELVSGTSYPVAHRFFMEVLDVGVHLREWEKKVDFNVFVGRMRDKFDKYWGEYKKLNKYMYFALILDPCMKMGGVAHGLRILLSYGRGKEVSDDVFKSIVEGKEKEVKDDFDKLFNVYKERFECLGENSSLSSKNSLKKVAPTQVKNSVVNAFLHGLGGSTNIQTELDKYLSEPCPDLEPEFDVLLWWKLNAPRFPIISRMAKDILAIQVSTVASESAFSTGGRILDPHRTRLSTALVEALICTQDWQRKSSKDVIYDDYVDLQKDEDVVREMEEELRRMTIKGKGIQVD